jgi:hypothetical protein
MNGIQTINNNSQLNNSFHSVVGGESSPSSGPTDNAGRTNEVPNAQKIITDNLTFTFITLNCKVNNIELEIKEIEDPQIKNKLRADNEFFKAQRYKVWSELKRLNSDLVKTIVLNKPLESGYEHLHLPPYNVPLTRENQIEILGFSPEVGGSKCDGLESEAPVTINQFKAPAEAKGTKPTVDKSIYVFRGHNLTVKQTTPISEVKSTFVFLSTLSPNQIKEIDSEKLKLFFSNVTLNLNGYPKATWAEVIDLLLGTLPASLYHTQYDYRVHILDLFTTKLIPIKSTLREEFMKTKMIHKVCDWLQLEYQTYNYRAIGTILRFLCEINFTKSREFGIDKICERLKSIDEFRIADYVKFLISSDLKANPDFKSNVTSTASKSFSNSFSPPLEKAAIISNTPNVTQSVLPPNSVSPPLKKAAITSNTPNVTKSVLPPPSNSAYSRRSQSDQVPQNSTNAKSSSFSDKSSTIPQPSVIETGQPTKKLAFTSYMASKKTKPTTIKVTPSPDQKENITEHYHQPGANSNTLRGILKSTEEGKPRATRPKKKVLFKADDALVSVRLIESREKTSDGTHKTVKEFNKDEGVSFAHSSENELKVNEEVCEVGWSLPKPTDYAAYFDDDRLSDFSVARGGTLPIKRREGLDEELRSVIKNIQKYLSQKVSHTPFEPEEGLVTKDKIFSTDDYDNIEVIPVKVENSNNTPTNVVESGENKNLDQSVLDLLQDHDVVSLGEKNSTFESQKRAREQEDEQNITKKSKVEPELANPPTSNASVVFPVNLKDVIPTQEPYQLPRPTSSNELLLPTKSHELPKPTSSHSLSGASTAFAGYNSSSHHLSQQPPTYPPPRNHSIDTFSNGSINNGYHGSSRSGVLPNPSNSYNALPKHPVNAQGIDILRLRQMDVRPQVRNNNTDMSKYNTACRYFPTGQCSYGDRCFYLHIPRD